MSIPWRRVALDVARRTSFLGTDLEKIRFAVHEVLMNAIIHGSHLEAQKKLS
jgi:hypothetical protein